MRLRVLVRSPRFEPGSSAWQADVLDQTRLRPRNMLSGWSSTRGDVKHPKVAIPSVIVSGDAK